jgi:hypothetical protein
MCISRKVTVSQCRSTLVMTFKLTDLRSSPCFQRSDRGLLPLRRSNGGRRNFESRECRQTLPMPPSAGRRRRSAACQSGRTGRTLYQGTHRYEVSNRFCDTYKVRETPTAFTCARRGYWRNEEATKASFTPDGWYRSGDIAHIDPNGHV